MLIVHLPTGKGTLSGFPDPEAPLPDASIALAQPSQPDQSADHLGQLLSLLSWATLQQLQTAGQWPCK
jgi:hypothetical protein